MGEKKRVLIVEDDVIVKSSLERLLRESDCEIESVHSAEEGLERFAQAPCDLVLTDLKLPGMDGLEMIARMRQMDEEPPFIVLTAYGGADDFLRALKLGAIDFFSKPFDAQQILDLTRKYIETPRSKQPDLPGGLDGVGFESEVAMRATDTPKNNMSSEDLTPEFKRLYRLLAPFISLGRQGTGITHNLNGPLTGMMGHLELLKMKRPEWGEDIDTVMDLAKKLRDNIADLQIKFENETLREAQPQNINQILRFELNYLQSDLFFKHYIQREIDLEEQLPNVNGIYADFALAFEEILINAVDAQRDNKEGWMKVKTYSKDGAVYIEVEDGGPGFSPQALQRAFDPYWPDITMLETGQVRVGMGLCLARQWLEPYGGRIELENREPRGARVRIMLPQKGGGSRT